MCGLILWKGYTWVIRLWRTIGPNSDCTGSPGLGSFWVLWTLLCICDVVPSLCFYMGCVMPQHTQYAAMNCPGAISFFYPQHIALSLGDKQQTLLPWVFLPSHSTFFFSLQHFPVLMVLIPTCMYLCGFLPFFFTSSLLCVPVPSICILQPYLRSFQVWVVPFQTSSSVSLVSSLISLALFLCYSLTLYVFFSIFSSFSFLWQYFL